MTYIGPLVRPRHTNLSGGDKPNSGPDYLW